MPTAPPNPTRSTPAALGLALVSAILICVAGCAAPPKPDPAAAAKLVTLPEVDQLNRAFADRFVLLVAAACDQIEQDNPSATQRRMAHELKLYCATSAFDIASNPDPYTSLLDMTLSVTLISQVWIDEDRAEEMFGPERARILIHELRRARVEVWEIAARVLKPEHLDALDYLIWDWRQNNPNVVHVEFVRFNNFSAGRGKSQLADVRTGGGFLAPVNEAKRAVDEVRLLTERAFYFGKRAPLTLSWQIEAATNNLMSNAEVGRVLTNLDTFAASADRLTIAIDRLPKDIATQREAVLSAIDQREKMLNSTIANVRGAIGDTERGMTSLSKVLGDWQRTAAELRTAADAVTGTANAIDAFSSRFSGPQNVPGRGAATQPVQSTAATPVASAATATPVISVEPIKPAAAAKLPAAVAIAPAAPAPFDIKNYTDTAIELAKAARELRMFVDSTQGLVGSDAWTHRIQEINEAADDRMRMAKLQSQTLVDEVFRRVYISIGALFVLALCWRLLVTRLKHRHAVSDR
jgi:hypothetical protein